MTPNPINALKRILFNAKHTNNSKIHFQISKRFEITKIKLSERRSGYLQNFTI